MFNIGACYEALGRVDDARARYQAIGQHPDVAPDLAAQAQELLNRLAVAVQPPTGQYTQHGGLTRRQVATIWDAVEPETPHTGPGLCIISASAADRAG